MLKSFSCKSFLLFFVVFAFTVISTAHAPLVTVAAYDDDTIPRSITFLSYDLPDAVPEKDNKPVEVIKIARGNDHSVLRVQDSARWQAGLTAFYNGQMKTAAQYFSAVLNEDRSLPESDRAAAAFWAYRAFYAADDQHSAVHYLAIAASQKPCFYSIMARRISGRETISHDLQASMLLDASTKEVKAVSYPMPNWTPSSGYKVEPALLFAIMRQESEFHTGAQSSRGARGVMQLMPATAHAMASTIKLSGSMTQPEVSMALGQQYLQRLMDVSSIRNNLVFLLAAYNAGPAMVDKWRSNTAYNNDPLLFIESIPYGSTRDYVVNVIGNYWVYSELFGSRNPSLTMITHGKWPLYAGSSKPFAAARNIAGIN